MILTQLEISGLRNLRRALLTPSPGFNQIVGANGAGKSSVLEAIHCLSVGHSFRTRKARELITHGEDEFTLACQMRDPQLDQLHRCGLRRSRDGATELRLDYEEIRSMAQVTQLLPVKALTPDSHQLIQDGPNGRRQFIDWGVFHMEQSFFQSWRKFKRSLAQRNQALKDGAADSEIQSWDDQLIESGEEIDQYRRQYVKQLDKTLQTLLTDMGTVFHVELRYRSGWPDGLSLEEAIAKNYPQCRKFRTTTVGPHRGELVINANETLARQVLSRGQQKLLVYGLHLAQLTQLHSASNNLAIVLCDDLPSELDADQCSKILDQLVRLQSQIFLTSTVPQTLPTKDFSLFSVLRGEVKIGV